MTRTDLRDFLLLVVGLPVTVLVMTVLWEVMR